MLAMKKIFKYVIDNLDKEARFSVPLNSKVLSIQVQDGRPTIWMLIDDSIIKNSETRIFKLFATGEEFDTEEWNVYYGTVQLGSRFVLHLFEKDII